MEMAAAAAAAAAAADVVDLTKELSFYPEKQWIMLPLQDHSLETMDMEC